MPSTLLYITFSSREEALSVAHTLVKEHLIACGNIIDGVTSVYEWQGEVHEDSELVLLAKTDSNLVEQATARILELHSYDCPCVTAIPIEGGNPAFLQWVNDQTRR
ncbi:divalent-cation tolerance protein CutA [Calycomorphotria hydatis]|uniref:Divalent-cation tolerance protein CutA n=1 Tax=Calycomorphotria hydatis TaxID=2528027 RepID=A0A517T4F6_9PLAN|nr:divalent-cation tolerance protein CutA [Calycomorphotria hydatis]QDT63266.1 Divalent-cation tolerance protein CutA [Calycomorphotria hydatis]